MAVTLFSNPYGTSLPFYPYTANATINKGDIVVETAGANFKCDPAPANPNTVLKTVGVAVHTANANETVQVLRPLPGMIFVADSNANSAAANCVETFVMTSAGVIEAGTPLNAGGRVRTVAMYGAAASKQYLVHFVQSNCAF
jgi:hypothetical protein